MYIGLGERRKSIQWHKKGGKVFKETGSANIDRLKGIKKNKPRKNVKFTESWDSVYYCVVFDF